jgi:glycosyltransferase involved in cell wall biosynthesis
LKKQIPIVIEVEDLPLARRREWFNLKPRLDQCCWKGMLQRASAFTAVNGYILNLLPDNKPKYLLPGIIDDQLLKNSRSRLMPFSGTSRTIGYFGALTEDKGSAVLLDLVPRLPDAWRLVVTGSGPLAPDFERLNCRFPDRLNFLGRIDETRLYQAMCACDCTVIPMERISYEGKGVFPFKTLEFIAAGTHVIASPLATLGDLNLAFIQRWDGKSVDQLLVEIACAESKFMQEQSIRQNAITTILDRYSLSGVANLFSRLFRTGLLPQSTQN